jgi:hypothetical protein
MPASFQEQQNPIPALPFLSTKSVSGVPGAGIPSAEMTGFLSDISAPDKSGNRGAAHVDPKKTYNFVYYKNSRAAAGESSAGRSASATATARRSLVGVDVSPQPLNPVYKRLETEASEIRKKIQKIYLQFQLSHFFTGETGTSSAHIPVSSVDSH